MADSRSRLGIFLEAAGLIHSSAATHYGLTPAAEYYKANYEGPAGMGHTEAYDYGSETYYIDSKKSKYAGYYGKTGGDAGGKGATIMTASNVGDAGKKRGGNEEEYVDRHGVTAAMAGTFDREHEKRVRRRIDLRLLPALFIVLLFASFIRENLQFAAFKGMREDLNLENDQISTLTAVGLVPIIVFAIPANLLLRYISPSTWLAALLLGTGIISIGQGFVHGFGALTATQFLLGIFQAGILPGIVYVLTRYYPRFALLKRLAVVFSAAIIAQALGGYLAFAMEGLNEHQDLHTWNWIFIMEGIMATIAATLVKFLIPSWPEGASFLNAEDKAVLAANLSADIGAARMDELNSGSLRRILTDLKIWAGVLAYFCASYTSVLTQYFATVQGLGYEKSDDGYLSHTTPAAVLALPLLGIFAYLSDGAQHRYTFSVFASVTAIIGFALALKQDSIGNDRIRDLGVYFATMGSLTLQPILVGWLMSCTAGDFKRNIAVAMQIGLGSAGGILACCVIPGHDEDDLSKALMIALGLMGACILVSTFLFAGNKVENSRRKRGGRDERLQLEDANNLGDDHPHFVLAT